MTRRIALSTVLLGLVLLIAAGPGLAAPPAGNPGQDRLQEMIAQGWKPAAPGVLKRVAGGQTETYGLGLEGFQYGYEQLRKEYGTLYSEFHKTHDGKLLQTLNAMEREMVRLQGDIQALQSLSSPSTPVGCDFSFGAHANAYPTSPAQGVGADASAYFNNNCGYSGDTYAYVYARAAVGTVTTTKTVTDPRTGSNITSSVTATVAGDHDCYSYATSRTSSVDLGIYYSTSAENFLCPAPLVVTVSGLSSVSIFGYNCKTVTWTSSVSGGTGSYPTYTWYMNGYLVQNGGTSYSTMFCGDDYTWTDYITMSLTVTDSGGTQGTGSKSTTIYYSGSGGGGGCLVAGDTAIIIPC